MTSLALTHSAKGMQTQTKRRTPPVVTFRMVPHGTRAYIETVVLREKVLREPLNMRFTAKELMKEADQLHLGFWFASHCVAAVVLKPLTPDKIQLRQMCVHPNFQGRGLGGALLTVAQEVARNENYKMLFLDARISALAFYEKHGFKAIGKHFYKVNLPHQRMFKLLV